MRRPLLTLTLAIAFSSQLAVANEYHLSPDGSGQWTTLQQAADNISPGNTCYVHPGSYRETVTLTKSGAKGKPIRFVAVGQTPVVLDGTEPIAAKWTRHKGSVYKAKVSAPVTQLFVDRKMMIAARWPNTTFDRILTRDGWAAVDRGSRYGKIKDKELAQTGVDWTGATAVLNIAHQFYTWSRPVLRHSAGSSTFEYAKDMGQQLEIKSSQIGYWEDDNYYLTGKLEALDAEGEWFHDAESGVLYLWAPGSVDPSTLNVEHKTRDLAITGKGVSHIEFVGFHFFGATFDITGEHITIDNCHLRYPAYAIGVPELNTPRVKSVITTIRGRHNTISNSSLMHSATAGLRMNGEFNTVDNCYVTDVCWTGTLQHHGIANSTLPGYGKGNNVIRNSTVHDIGGVGIATAGAPKAVVEYCHVYRGGLLCKDVSLVYTQMPTIVGTEYRYNWVHDSLSPSNSLGLRGDDQTRGLYLHHNVVWNCRRVGMVCKGDHNRGYNNTFLANGDNDIVWMGGPEPEKVWRKQHDLLKEQNRDSILINNAYRRAREHHRKSYDGIPGDVTNNYEGTDFGLEDWRNLDFRPKADSPLVDAGRVVEGITAPYQGKAPDIGAYERGGENWKPGHRNGVWVRRLSEKRGNDGEAAHYTVTLTAPISAPVEVRQVGVMPGGDSIRHTFRPEDSGRYVPLFTAPAKDGMRLSFETDKWGATETFNSSEADGPEGLRVYFAQPDLGSIAPIKPLFNYDQTETGFGAKPPALEAKPVGRAFRVKTSIAIDGRVSPGEWTGMSPERLFYLMPKKGGEQALGAAYALFDNQNLYIAFSINGAPADGETWGQSDGVEVDIEGKGGMMFVLDGFPSGKCDSVTDGGATENGAKAFGKSVEYAARVNGQQWTAEFRIPLYQLDDPLTSEEPIPFNLGARVDGQWLAWAQTTGANHNLDKAGALAFTPIVDASAENLTLDGLFNDAKAPLWKKANNAGRAIPQHRAEIVRESFDGSNCIRISCDNAEVMKSTVLKWTRSLDKSFTAGRYLLTYDLRVEGLKPQKPGGTFYAYVHSRSDEGQQGGGLHTRDAFAGANLPWTRCEHFIDIPPNMKPSGMMLQLHYATGTAWIDNVSLIRLP